MPLSRDASGPLYRVSLTDPDGAVVATFGRLPEGGRTRETIPLPNSGHSPVIEMDARALETADRVLHDLAAPYQLTETPLGAFAHLEDALSSADRPG